MQLPRPRCPSRRLAEGLSASASRATTTTKNDRRSNRRERETSWVASARAAAEPRAVERGRERRDDALDLAVANLEGRASESERDDGRRATTRRGDGRASERASAEGVVVVVPNSE